jgi:dTDP-4-dehydrorhamnose 3,5-epimerase
MIPGLNILPTPILGLSLIHREPVEDSRGCFERIFCEETLRDLLSGKRIVQINHAVTWAKGAMRGLHFQYQPHAETKIVYCQRGKVFDVAVDLRRDSPTFLHWHGEMLSEDNHTAFFIPEGFAHGFQSLTENCAMLYLHTAAYRPEAEGGIHLLDPRVGIAWPLPVAELSPRDAAHPLLGNDFTGITL